MEVSGQLFAPVALPPGERAHGTNLVGGWVGSRVDLDAVAKRKFPSPCWESKVGRATRSLMRKTQNMLRMKPLGYLGFFPTQSHLFNWTYKLVCYSLRALCCIRQVPFRSSAALLGILNKDFVLVLSPFGRVMG
jgi:hypothetical protein